MDTKSLAKLIIRLIAAHTIWSSITQLPMLTMILQENAEQYSHNTPAMVLMATLGPILLATALWRFSGPLATLLAGTPSTDTSEAMQTPALHAIAISTAGLVMVLWTLPKLISYAVHNFSLDAHSDNLMIDFLDIMVPVLQCLFGLSMAFGAGLWGAFIRRFKTFGLQNK